jgi:hypothetical protein
MAKKQPTTQPAIDLSQLVSLPEAAQIADVDETWLRRLIRDGKIVGLKIGRNYLVDRNSAAAYQRIPGMGRPRVKRRGKNGKA